MGKHRDESIFEGKGERDCMNRPQNVHRQEGGKINKDKTIKVNLMHKHFIHVRSYITWHSHIASDICVLSEIGIQAEKGFCAR